MPEFGCPTEQSPCGEVDRRRLVTGSCALGALGIKSR
jgi:hypothetical protein